MKFRIITYLTLLQIIALLLTGCSKQLDIDPVQQIPADGALSTIENIDAVVIGLYARLKNARQYGRDLITHPEALADNGHATNASGRLLQESNNVFGAHFTNAIWQNSYVFAPDDFAYLVIGESRNGPKKIN